MIQGEQGSAREESVFCAVRGTSDNQVKRLFERMILL